MESKVFEALCRHSCCIMGGWYPYPSTCIKEVTGLSLYKVRKELHTLRDLGLVEVDRYCEVGEDRNYLISGWRVTDKGRQTEIYKRLDKEEADRVRECFHFDIENSKNILES